MHISRYALLSGTLVLATLASEWVAAAPPRPAPNVMLQDADGSTVELAAYKGKVVIVDFWATWCPPCKTSFPALDSLYREYQSRGVEVLAVNLDERRRDADMFLGDHPHHLTVFFDPQGASPAAFGVKGMPSSFLIDKVGRIRFTHMGYSGDVHQTYRKEIAQLIAESQEP
jgi:cytochrome c biogenesis protein CcmG/thiol:disulfide interchange protein DsbE